MLGVLSEKEVSEPPWRAHFAKATREARKIFESGAPPDDGKNANFAETVINEFRGAALLPSTRHRQALPDYEHLSSTILVEAAERLRRAASDGCDDSLLAIIAFVCGLSLRTTHRVPLFGFSDDPIIELDTSLGVLITDLDLVFTKSARPRANDAHRPACRVITKPLPLFVASALTKRLTATPDAQCLAHLLPQATCNGSRLALPDQPVGLEASLARFIRSASGFAVGQGVDRLASAAMFNDFGIIPASKVYYCQVERQELWRVAGHLYDELGWGLPSPYADGVGFGSRVTPTREAIRDWHRWLRDGLEACRPGKNSGIESLLAFHNQFAAACAATTAFCLALRGVARISATADALTPDSKSILVFDKRVGHLPRPLPVPVNAVVAAQAGLWMVHCRALERRLAGKGVAAGASVRQCLLAVARQERVEMFFLVDKKLRPQSISSHDLVRDLPAQFGFDADFGRHFWESELRRAGIGSSDVDLLMRHQVVGIEGHRSTSDKSLTRSFSEISHAQEELLASLDISPMAGLARK